MPISHLVAVAALLGGWVPSGDLDEELAQLYQPNQCGPIALSLACRVFDVDASITEIAGLSGATDKGTSMAGLVRAARAKGLHADALNSSTRHLRRLRNPAIIDFPSGHFCLLVGWRAGAPVVFDLPGGERVVNIGDFEASWGKHVIVLNPRTHEGAPQ